MSKKKDCMFQVALSKPSLFGGYSSDVDIPENTDLITREEAEELWEKYYPKVLENLKDGGYSTPETLVLTLCYWQLRLQVVANYQTQRLLAVHHQTNYLRFY